MAEHATRELTAAPIARYAGTRRIIRAAEFGVITDAATLLDAARAQAESILAQARQDAASLRVQEATRGYQDGLARARDEYAASIVAHHTDDAQRAAALEERVCLMVTCTLNKVLGAHEHDEQFFASVIPRVLRATRDEKYLTMRVATAQREAAQAAVERALQGQSAPAFIAVVADDRLSLGACLIESPHGLIDASLATQLAAIGQAVQSAWHSAPNPYRPEPNKDMTR